MLKTALSLALALLIAAALYIIMMHVSVEVGEVIRAAAQSR